MMSRFLTALLGVLFLCLSAGTCLAVTVLTYPKFQAIDSVGVPLSGGKVYTYEVGSTTAKATYSDPAGTTQNANPVILDSRGEANIYLNGTYKIVIYDSTDSLIVTVDKVKGTTNVYDTSINSGTTGYIAYYSGTTSISGVAYLSGVSIDPNTDILAGVSTSRTVTGKTYFCDLTSANTTLGGTTVYGGAVGNYGSTSEVTGTMTPAIKGMSVLVMLTQGQAAGSSMYIKFNVADSVIGVTSAFNNGASVIALTGTTMSSFVQLDAWQNGRWYVSGASGMKYRNQ